jgi:hypothetical protein
VANQENSEDFEFIEEISEKGLDLSYQILVLGIVVDQLVICTLQVMEIREIRRLLPSSQY